MKFFKDGDNYIGITDESPRGMKGVLFVGRGSIRGFGPEAVCEQVFAVNQIAKFTPVTEENVPDAWYEAITGEKKKKTEAWASDKARPIPLPKRPITPVEIATIVGLFTIVAVSIYKMLCK